MRFSCLFVVACVAVAGCRSQSDGNGSVPVIAEGKFSFVAPQGWKIPENPVQRNGISIESPESFQPQGSMLVSSPKPTPGLTLNQIMENLDKSNQKTTPSYSPLTYGQTELDGEQAKYIVFNTTTGKEKKVSLWMKQLVALHNGKQCMIICVAFNPTPGALKPVFNDMIKSFRWEPSAQ